MRFTALWTLCVLLFGSLAYPAGYIAASGIAADVNQQPVIVPQYCAIICAFGAGTLLMLFLICASTANNNAIASFVWLLSLPCASGSLLYWSFFWIPKQWLSPQMQALQPATNEQVQWITVGVGILGFLLFLLSAALNHGEKQQEPSKAPAAETNASGS